MRPSIDDFGVFEAHADTPVPPTPTTSPRRIHVIKKMTTKAGEILSGSAALYRELTVSALSLVPGRGQSA